VSLLPCLNAPRTLCRVDQDEEISPAKTENWAEAERTHVAKIAMRFNILFISNKMFQKLDFLS
jgi:hypothetical protein